MTVTKSLVTNEVEDIEARACSPLECQNSAHQHFGRRLAGRALHSLRRVVRNSIDLLRRAWSRDLESGDDGLECLHRQGVPSTTLTLDPSPVRYT
jgi:hypothetical protein